MRYGNKICLMKLSLISKKKKKKTYFMLIIAIQGYLKFMGSDTEMRRVIFRGSSVARRLKPQSITIAFNLLFFSRDVKDSSECATFLPGMHNFT